MGGCRGEPVVVRSRAQWSALRLRIGRPDFAGLSEPQAGVGQGVAEHPGDRFEATDSDGHGWGCAGADRRGDGMESGNRLVVQHQGRRRIEYTLDPVERSWSLEGPELAIGEDSLQGEQSLCRRFLLYLKWRPGISVMPGFGIQHVDDLDPEVRDDRDQGIDGDDDRLEAVGEVVRRGLPQLEDE